MRIPKNETPNSMFIKKMLDKTPTTETHLRCNRHIVSLVDRIQDFAATKVDLHWKDDTTKGRPAGSRIVENEHGEFILVTN